MLKVLITGANGLLGQKLIHHYRDRPDVELIATARNENKNPRGNYSYVSLDITQRELVSKTISSIVPDVIINTAAMTHVDECELNPHACHKINVEAVRYLVESAEHVQSFFLHLSTDFVFDGTNGPYVEEDAPNPLSRYAESKLTSEKIVEESSLNAAVLRTMLVYGVAHSMSRSNIVLWVKDSLEQGKKIKVVDDQWRTPTLAEDLAKGCALAVEKKATGCFHISGKDLLTPYEMAVLTARCFGLDESLIEKTDGSVFTQPAKRPRKTGFVLDKARRVLGYEPLSFLQGLDVLKNQLEQAN